MLELIIMIGVIKAFHATAKKKNFTGWIWGLIGALSYYGPILIMSFLVFPWMIREGIIEVQSQGSLIGLAIGINLLTGIGCCAICWFILRSMEPAQLMNSEALDAGEILNSDNS